MSHRRRLSAQIAGAPIIRAEIISGLGIMTSIGQPTTTDLMMNYLRDARGFALMMFRPAHGGEWRRYAPAGGCQTFAASDFGILNTADPTVTGKLRVETLKALDQIHRSDLETKIRWAVSYGAACAVGKHTGTNPDNLIGPINPTTNLPDGSINWMTRNNDAAFGVDPFPLANVNSAGVASTSLMVFPGGEYDVTLTDGSKGSRMMAWLEQDLRAMNQFFDEDCEYGLAGYTAEWMGPHKRRVHFPWNQMVPAVMEGNSNEHSRGFEGTLQVYPTCTSGAPPLLNVDSGDAISWKTNAPPTTGTAGAEWSPLLINGTPVNGRWFAMVYDRRDPANKYEVFPITSVTATAADFTTGTLTVQGLYGSGTSGRGKFGPIPKSGDYTANNFATGVGKWTQTGTNDIAIAIFKWVAASASDYVGTPGVTGVAATNTVQTIDRSTRALQTGFATVVPTNVVCLTSMMMQGWYARDHAGTVWKTCEYGADNYPYPADYTWTGSETEQQVETIMCKAYARHAIDCAFQIAKTLGGRHVYVSYYGMIFSAPWATRYTGLDSTADLTETIVTGWDRAVEKTIPDNSYMGRDTRRTSGTTQVPAVVASATEYWSPSDAIFRALAIPGRWNPAYLGWENRFASGVTHIEATTSQTPWEIDPEDYGAWLWLKKWLGSSAKIVGQCAGTSRVHNGPEMIHTIEDMVMHPTVRPVYFEFPNLRLSASSNPTPHSDSCDISTAYRADPGVGLKGGWPGAPGKTSVAQQWYLLGTDVGYPSADNAYAATAIGRRMRSDTGDTSYLAST